jgi:hypothetical protein
MQSRMPLKLFRFQRSRIQNWHVMAHNLKVMKHLLKQFRIIVNIAAEEHLPIQALLLFD